MLDKEVITMYYSIDEFIRKHDKEGNVKKAIADCLTQNMTKEVALDILAHDLQVRLYDYIWSDPDLNIDDGSNVRSDFTKEIKIPTKIGFSKKIPVSIDGKTSTQDDGVQIIEEKIQYDDNSSGIDFSKQVVKFQ